MLGNKTWAQNSGSENTKDSVTARKGGGLSGDPEEEECLMKSLQVGWTWEVRSHTRDFFDGVGEAPKGGM